MSNQKANQAKRTWSQVVLQILRSTGQPMTFSELNRAVETEAPELVAHNAHWKDKIRQVVQRLRDKDLATNVEKGVWQAVVGESSASSGEQQE